MFTIHNQKFGAEVEFSGISRYKAATVVQEVLDGRLVSDYMYGRQVYSIYDQQGREWKMLYDGSVNSIRGGDKNELVTPPLTYADMDTLQEVVRQLRKSGAKIDSSCGMHVHVDIQNHTVKSLKNLVKFYAKYEDMFYKACEVLPGRAVHYAQKFTKRHSNLVSKIGTVNTLDDIKHLWYGLYGDPTSKYDDTRYSGLNFHNIWYKGWMKGTVEFRLFNATLHAGEIRSYIVLALAVSAKALNANSVNNRRNEIVPDEFLFPKVLAGMGITASDELTKNVYKHLTKKMRAS